MKTIEIISQDLFDKIRSRFENLQMGDENGGVTMDPREARFFDFDFAIEGNNLGRVSISINELGTLKVFYGKSLLEDSDLISRDFWYDFLREMRNFAKRRLLRFDTRDITKNNLNKDDFQYLAANGPKDETMNMSESAKFSGGKMRSYSVLERTKIILKHKKGIEDESYGARSRIHNIESIFIENELGERYKMPVMWLEGAKAMQMHCAHGGKPYDSLGGSIIDMCEQVAQLSAFKRHMSRHDSMNKEVNEISERANLKLENLKQLAHKIATRPGYKEWSEGFEPISTMQGTVEMDQATLEDYKSKFTIPTFKEDLAQFFPLIHRIMQEAGTVDLEDYVGETSEEECNECGMYESQCKCVDVKEGIFTKFENWADAVTEGTLEPDALAALAELLTQDITVGDSGTAGIEALQGIGINYEPLEDLITAKAKIDPTTPLKDAVGEWLAKDDPEAAQELGLIAQPVEQPVSPEQGMAEGPADEPVHPDDDADDKRWDDMDEATEDRTSYQVARYLFDKGLRYQPENEKEIIKMIGGAMMKMGMNHKQVRYLMSYDEDFLSDTLSELRHMEQAVDEVGESADMDKIPAYIRKQKQQSQDTAQKSVDQKNQQAGAKVWNNPRLPKENDGYEPELKQDQEKPSIRDLAQWLGGHYNKNYKEEGFKSPWRKGTTELAIMAKKEFGEEYGAVVERMVSDMDESPLARIHREGGLRRAEEMDEALPGEASPLSKVDNPRLPKGPEEDQFEAILRLAGLAK